MTSDSLAPMTPDGWTSIRTLFYKEFLKEHQAMRNERDRLCAVVPDLLEACKAVVARWSQGDLAEAARMCDAAIAKAERTDL